MSVTLEAELELMRNKAFALQEEVNDLARRLGEEVARSRYYEIELQRVRDQRDKLREELRAAGK